MIHYENGPKLRSEVFIDCLIRSTLSERRPIADPKRIEGMLRHADVVPNAQCRQIGTLMKLYFLVIGK
jgi:hypothetical protein